MKDDESRFQDILLSMKQKSVDSQQDDDGESKEDEESCDRMSPDQIEDKKRGTFL